MHPVRYTLCSCSIIQLLFLLLGREKRKKSDDEDLDDRLEDEDYDLLEENLGVKVERRVFYEINVFVKKYFLILILEI